MALTSSGQVRYTLKTPYRDGTTHIVLEPLDLMARLAALVPPPRMHMTRFHGVFAPHSKLRAAVTPAHRGIGAPKASAQTGEQEQPPTPRHVSMNWARRLKRVVGIDIEACVRCGGKLAIIASIEEPQSLRRSFRTCRRRSRSSTRPSCRPERGRRQSKGGWFEVVVKGGGAGRRVGRIPAALLADCRLAGGGLRCGIGGVSGQGGARRASGASERGGFAGQGERKAALLPT
jgi:hypothetical protein